MTSTTGVLGGIVGVVAIVVICGLIVAGMYNSLVGADVGVEAKWGNVQSAYQRRADLIPNLVETVKGARDFEQEARQGK
jgi:LemA protein